LTHVGEKWTQLKVILEETAEHTVGYQPELCNRRCLMKTAKQL